MDTGMHNLIITKKIVAALCKTFSAISAGQLIWTPTAECIFNYLYLPESLATTALPNIGGKIQAKTSTDAK
jgi:hypothetical protein